jgi:hypothetical protein
MVRVDSRTMGLFYPSDIELFQMLSDLREEREQINEAIIALERVALGQLKRRRRSPAWLAPSKNKRNVDVRQELERRNTENGERSRRDPMVPGSPYPVRRSPGSLQRWHNSPKPPILTTLG